MFTSRDLLGELARYPNKADGLKTKAHEFMIPLGRMVYASAKDSLYQCLLVMSELKVRRPGGRAGWGAIGAAGRKEGCHFCCPGWFVRILMLNAVASFFFFPDSLYHNWCGMFFRLPTVNLKIFFLLPSAVPLKNIRTTTAAVVQHRGTGAYSRVNTRLSNRRCGTSP